MKDASNIKKRGAKCLKVRISNTNRHGETNISSGFAALPMHRLCKEHGIPEPEYTVHPNDIMMLFRAKNPGLHGRDQENVQENVQEKSRASVIIDFIHADSSISLRELSKKLGVSSKTVQREIEKLKTKNAIRRVGGDKGGHWEIG